MAVTGRWSLRWKWDQAARKWEAGDYTIERGRNEWILRCRGQAVGAIALTVEAAMDEADRHRGVSH